ncbi:hypothetical protein SEA_FINDLEY_26 [Mycobacterium phage Findley]|uniref:PH domain-containing protein n=1 Tax=Mycobacterium phage Findley TaxID=2015882 RepID=A0A222ZPV6_9CAUD|nr:hypothetical protein I5G77_gp26 [Mycobacterium phage Findley]ASR86766.1 hypothetical protein SEA_FINDLEY_26 [Mycobacterium phage Findley]
MSDPDNDYTFCVYYEGQPVPGGPWQEYVALAPSLADAEQWVELLTAAVDGNPYVRNLTIGYAPKVTWQPWPPGDG